MKNVPTLIMAVYLAGPAAVLAEERAPQLAPVDTSSLWSQISDSQRPFPLPSPAEQAMQRPLMLAKIQSETLKTIAISLKGLEEQNSPRKAPAEYTRGAEDLSREISERLFNIEEAIKLNDPTGGVYFETVEMAPLFPKLTKLAQSIEGDPNYAFWGGDSIKNISLALERNIAEIRINAPFVF